MSTFIKLSICVGGKNLLGITKNCTCKNNSRWYIFSQLDLPRLYSKNNKSDDDRSNPHSDTKVKNEDIDLEIGFNYSKYKVFKDTDSPIVLDVEEERMLLQENLEQSHIPVQPEFEGINLNRGITGVFEIEDLVDVLRKDNAQDIFVATLPQSAKYVDYIVIVTGKSQRHMIGLAEFIRKLYKKKRSPSDIIPRIEGENSSDWIALDLGNIALHIFSRDARPVYDLESLWSLGPEYDLHLNAPEDPLVALLKKHTISLDDLRPDSLR